jgi:non-specific serine/threonine protein kinase/serine/threonine-protein kinase
MPWIEGLPLDEYVKKVERPKSRKAEIDRLVALFVKICDAVAHAHQRGVMHLDLKPSNVRVDPQGEPIVMDFGVARLTETDYPEPLGAPLGAAGTPLYMAPEQIENRDDLDIRADVFALGLLLYEALVGRRARGDHWGRVAVPTRELALERPPSPRSVNPEVPAELEAIVLRALDWDRNGRYQSARALADDLAAYRQGGVVGALADYPGYRLRKWLQANRLPLTTLTLIFIVVGMSVGFKLQMDRVIAEQNEKIERGTHEASTVAAQSELIRAYGQMAEMAIQLGNLEKAAEFTERAEAIRAHLRGTAPSTE